MANEKKAAKKTAASDDKTDETETERKGAAPAGSADQGPGTAQPEPDPEPEASRTPEGTVNPDNAPEDVQQQTEPEQGYEGSSTDHTYAAAGGRTIAGESHDGLVDEDGNAVSGDSLFDEGDGSQTFVTAKQRTYEEFYYPNTTEKVRRLLFMPGQRVGRDEAERIKATL